MEKVTTAERLRQIMNERNLRQVDILTMAKPYCDMYGVKLGKNAISQYVSGKVEPGQYKLTVLGLALDVSEGWLMGFDVPRERMITPASNNESGRTKDFVVLFEKLTAEQQALIISQIKGILSER